MSDKVKPIPDGFHTITPYLIIKGAVDALEFYKKSLNATEIMRLSDDKGRIQHAEMRIGNSMVMIADEFPEMGVRSAQSFGGSPITLHLYVEDVDALAKQAIAAGMKVIRPIKDQFYGDRSGGF